MRQKFDIGDLVYCPLADNQRAATGIVVKSELINNQITHSNQLLWHTDEYHCKVCFINGDDRWVRAKWLQHCT